MMNPEIKAKWIEALRSGKYDQGKQFLRRDDKFCCLGVLCDILNLETNQGLRPQGLGFDSPFTREFGSPIIYGYYDKNKTQAVSNCVVPEHVAREIELDSLDQTKLTIMNDDGADFKTISDYIEKNL